MFQNFQGHVCALGLLHKAWPVLSLACSWWTGHRAVSLGLAQLRVFWVYIRACIGEHLPWEGTGGIGASPGL